jgi:hypothetical protein
VTQTEPLVARYVRVSNEPDPDRRRVDYQFIEG